MKIDKALVATITFVLTFLFGLYLGQYIKIDSLLFPTTATPAPEEKVIKAVFNCDNNKSISTEFTDRKVSLVLSDGRTMTLNQTISGSGARYANADESFVFWNKGDTAFVQEGNDYTYQNCVTTTN